jgi:hypothetical protein
MILGRDPRCEDGEHSKYKDQHGTDGRQRVAA